MYILKNAFRSITRSKGRNTLIGIIVFAIALSSCIALSIKESAKKTENENLEKLKITANISVDRQSIMKNSNPQSGDRDSLKSALQSVSSLSLEDLKKYADAPSVESFHYTNTASLNADSNTDLEPVDSNTSSSEETTTSTTNNGKMQSSMPGVGTGTNDGPKMIGGMGKQGDFTIVGYSSQDAMTDFISGNSTISEGNIFEENETDMTCIISDELAAFNSINVGSTLSLVNPNNEEEIYTLTVVGIYKNNTSISTTSGSMHGFNTMSDPANKIYTSYNTLNSIITTSKENATTETDTETSIEKTSAIREQVSGTYVFSDLESYNNFETEVRDMGLSNTYTVSSSDVSNYEKSVEPLKNISKFAIYFLLVVLGIGGCILIVLNMFNIRERKYEIGVLTAIGMKKRNVAIQFVIELFSVTFIALMLGTAVGASVSLPVTNKLLESQISIQQEEIQSVINNFGGKRPEVPQGGNMVQQSSTGNNNGTAESYISEVSSATDINVVMQLIGIGVILTVLSSASAIVFAMRYEPLKILNNRD